ncbi:MAG TPA: RDD family protein [Candidatus Acidoferrales bacterium]
MGTSIPLTPSEAPASTALLPASRALAGVWRRTLAFIIDACILGLPAAVLAVPFFDFLSRLAPWAKLIGFCIALPYFAILDSRIGGGQTLGQRLLAVEVVDASGQNISFGKSLLRYFIFAVPYFLNRLELSQSGTPAIVLWATSLIIFGVGGSTFYLMLFNRHSRQGLHDLAVGSYVVDAHDYGPVAARPIWPTHRTIMATLVLILVGTTMYFEHSLEGRVPFAQLLLDQAAIEKMPQVRTVGLSDMRNLNNGETQHVLGVSVAWTGKVEDEQKFADEVARFLLENDPTAQDYERIQIVLWRGYDLGIANSQVSHTFAHTPEEWKARFTGEPASSNQK